MSRRLKKEGIDYIVVAPSLVPQKSGLRIKTDRKDSRKLAHYLRSAISRKSGFLTSKTEALRDLERTRDDAKNTANGRRAFRKRCGTSRGRLCNRLTLFTNSGKPRNKEIVPLARELAGFIWSLGQVSQLLAPVSSGELRIEHGGRGGINFLHVCSALVIFD